MENLFQIIVGSEACPTSTVGSIMIPDPIIHANWSTLAINLNIPNPRIRKLRQDMQIDKITYADAVRDILELWKGRTKEEATLESLLDIIEDKCGAIAVGQSLRIEFNMPCNSQHVTSLRWEPLEMTFKTRAAENAKTFFPYPGLENALQNCKGFTLASLIAGKRPNLFKKTIPDKLSYYVNRTVISRNIISSKIFEQDLPDIFLFTGMDRYELYQLAKDKWTSVSTEQVADAVTARFIILDQKSHLNKIYDKVSQPVHLLHKENNGQLKWSQSKGGIGNLQRFVDPSSQDEILEELLCQNLNLHRMPVLISDSPGMGKSVLLAEIGRMLEKMYADRTVFYIVLSEFIKQVKIKLLEQGHGVPTKDHKRRSIEDVLQNLTCNNNFDKTVLFSKLASEGKLELELLFDGFDEIDSNDFKLAHDILRDVNNLFPSVRLWVTSRPHLLGDLEKGLDVLGFNIRAFNDADRVRFLTSFWTHHQGQIMDPQRLKEYARKCLEDLKSSINYADKHLAGIPLQCLLIGEVFEDSAREFAQPNGISTLAPEIEIDSIPNLYHRLIAKKLEKYTSVYSKEATLEERTLMEMHVRISIELIFSDQFEELKHLFPHLEHEEILKVGILEASSTVGAPRFIHRTFAEYFVAWFVVVRMQGGTVAPAFIHLSKDSFKQMGEEYSWGEELNGFFFNGALGSKRNVDVVEFVHQVISYFINSLIAKLPMPIPDKTMQHLSMSFKSETTMMRIAQASSASNLFQIFNFFNGMNAFEKHSRKIFDGEFLLMSMQYAGLGIVQFSLKHFETHYAFDEPIKCQALRVAVQRGAFSIVQFLIIKRQSKELVEKGEGGTRKLLFDCVENSNNDPVHKIKEKSQVIRLLLDINRKLLEERDDNGNTPLLSYHVHVDLLTELVKLGANSTARDKNRQSILDLSYSRDHLSSQDFQSVVAAIPKDNLRRLFRIGSTQKDDPLGRLLEKIDPTPKTFNMFKEVGANFTFVDDRGYSILTVAIERNRTATTIRSIIDCGAGLSWTGGKGETLLHFAAEKGNAQVVQMLLNKPGMEVNVRDNDGNTPLEYVIKSNSKSGNRLNSGLVLQKMGGTFKDIVHSGTHQEHWLHIAVRERNIQSVELLLQLGVDINVLDAHGNTPLHILSQKANQMDKLIAKLLLEKGTNPNLTNKQGETPFQLALKNEDLDFEIFKLLESKTIANYTPELATSGMRILIRKGKHLRDDEFSAAALEFEHLEANLNSQNERGDSLLHIAALSGHLRAAKFLVEKMKADTKSTNHFKESVLHRAVLCAEKGEVRLDIIKYLIDNGADMFTEDKIDSTFLDRFILTEPSPADLHSLVQYLAGKDGAAALFSKPRAGRDNATLLLHIALHVEAEEDTLTFLKIYFNVSFNALDSNGCSVLSYAVRGARSTKFLSCLIDQFKVDYQAVNNLGGSLLHEAASLGTVESLKFFLDFGQLDVNGADLDGDIPLHCALMHNQGLEKCIILIEYGADVGIVNKQGQSPLQLAIAKNNPAVQQYLEGIVKKAQEKASTFSRKSAAAVATSSKLNKGNIVNDKQVTLQAIKQAVTDKSDKLRVLIYSYIPDYSIPSTDVFHSLVEYLYGKDLLSLFNHRFEESGFTSLEQAVIHLELDHDTMLLLHKGGVDFNQVNDEGFSLLYYSVGWGRSPQFISTLIKHFGVDPSQQTANGETMLHIAANIGSVEVLRLFLDLKVLDVSGRNLEGNSPLHACLQNPATWENQMKKCKLLVEFGADVNLINHGRVTPLHFAANNPSTHFALEAIKFLIDEGADPFAVDDSDSDNQTFLHLFIRRLKPSSTDQLHSMIEYLVRKGLVRLLEIPYGGLGITPLQLMVRYVQVEEKTLRMLRSSNIDFNAVDGESDSILKHAMVAERSKEFLSTLINRFGVDPTHVNNKQNNLLHVAAYLGRLDALEFLLDMKTLDINDKNSDGNTPLHLLMHLDATQIDLMDKCKLLVFRGADTNSANDWGVTPLHCAALVKNPDVSLKLIMFLADNESNIHAVDDKGQTFLHAFVSQLAPNNLHLLNSIVEYLDGRNAVELFHTAENISGLTPFHNAVRQFEMKEKTLSMLYRVPTDFNKVDHDGESPLSNSMIGKRSRNFLELLVNKFGANPKHLNNEKQSMLHLAALHGTTDTLAYFLGMITLEINGKDSKGYTPLHVAAKQYINQLDVLEKCKLLVSQGADANSCNNKQETPLHLAASGIDKRLALSVIQLLIENGANVFAKREDNLLFIHSFLVNSCTPLLFHSLVHILLENDKLEIFNIPDSDTGATPFHHSIQCLDIQENTLMQMQAGGVKLSAVDEQLGACALTHAIMSGRSKGFISMLVDKFRLNPNHLNLSQVNLLHIAAIHGSATVMEYLLELNLINVNGQDASGNTPLHVALYGIIPQTNVIEKCRLLLNKNADINSTNHSGWTPIHMAANSKHAEGPIEIIKFLVRKGSNVLAKTEQDLNFLHIYILKESHEPHFHPMIKFLLAEHLDELCNTRGGPVGSTPLQLMVQRSEIEDKTLRMLFHSSKIDFNVLDNDGNSLLAYAVTGQRSNRFMTGLINNYGLDARHVNNSKENMLHIALQYGNLDALNFLLDLDVLDIDEKNSDGNSALHLGVQLTEPKDIIGKCKLLVNKGANVNSLNDNKDTVLHSAASNDDTQMALSLIQLLISNEADMFAKNEAKLWFIHCFILNSCTPQLFHALVEYMISKDKVELFHDQEMAVGATPLQFALLRLEPEEQTLDLLKLNNVDFNQADVVGASLLSYAIRGKRSATFMSVLINKFKVDLEQKNELKISLLHMATNEGTPDVLKIFLQVGTLDVNGRNVEGNTALHMAVHPSYLIKDYIEKCSLLISSGADVNLGNSAKMTPLHLTAIGQNTEVFLKLMAILIENGSDVYTKDIQNQTFLHVYISQLKEPFTPKLYPVVEYLLDKKLTEIFNTQGGNAGRTPLQLMVYQFEVEDKVLSNLHAAKVNFNGVDMDGDTILAHAIIGKRSTEFISNLVNKFGANPNHLNNSRVSLLHIVAQYGTPDTLGLFLDMNTLEVDGKNSDGMSPLLSLLAPSNEKTHVLKKCRMLIDKGAEVNQAHNGESLLHIASIMPDKAVGLEVLKFLVESGADVSAKNQADFTFLHIYILQHEKPTSAVLHELIEFLIDQKHSHLFNIPGGIVEATLLHCLMHTESLQEGTLSLLHSANANFNAIDNQDHSLLYHAIIARKSPAFLSSLISYGADHKFLGQHVFPGLGRTGCKCNGWGW